MKIGTCDADAIDQLKGRAAQDAAEHLPVRQHNDTTVKKVSFDPSANHRQQPGIAFVVGWRKGGITVGVTMDFDH